jgi:hypothetical protein
MRITDDPLSIAAADTWEQRDDEYFDLDYMCQPTDRSRYYKGVPSGIWYQNKEGELYYYFWADGAEDMSKMILPRDKTIISSNLKWVRMFKEQGYKALWRKVELVEID